MEYVPMIDNTTAKPSCPACCATLRQQLHRQVDEIADYCESSAERFFALEVQLKTLLWELGRLFISLFLLSRHQRLEKQPANYVGYRRFHKLLPRKLRTMFGEVVYQRSYWSKHQGEGGFHPLDAALGLTRDGFSALVISLATRLTAYLSYAKTTLVLEAFWGWSPSTETVEQWVLGVGRHAAAYMASGPPLPEEDGEVLVIEVDGKAVPTATDAELAKRRGPRKHKKKKCCQRHRGRAKRRDPQARKTRKKRRKKGDKSKNGRSATLVAVYTLRRGDDGKLHGPVNKRVWGSFASRKQMLKWVRAEATRRGFGPKSAKLVQIIVDGEVCFAKRLRKLFRKAILTLDIRHVEERLWTAGRAFHAEGSDELEAWVEELRKLLYGSGGRTLLRRLRKLRQQIASRGPGTATKREAVDSVIDYIEPRCKMMRYGKYIKKDLVISTGVIEGAVRYVIGERLDCSGMRWVEGKAEAILHIRCLEVNGLWDNFFQWHHDRCCQQLDDKQVVQIRTDEPLELSEAA
jgi:hypothetical protein